VDVTSPHGNIWDLKSNEKKATQLCSSARA